MSRIRTGITVTAGAAAGLFLATLASSATATADTAIPVNPGLPGVVEQMLASSAGIPQLLQTATSALTGAPLAPAASPAPAPIATATLNMPQTPAAQGTPGAPVPGNLASVLPFPLPNFGGTAPTAAAPSVTLPGAFLPSVPAAAPAQPALAPGLLIPGLP
ncbi:MAG TPA: hypothetical protein VFQ37_10625 [Mycobacterium sp.]|nr:hypothetical protein [Mycobacterium sp.]